MHGGNQSRDAGPLGAQTILASPWEGGTHLLFLQKCSLVLIVLNFMWVFLLFLTLVTL